MKTTHAPGFLLSFVSCCLFLVLAACSAGNYSAATITSAPMRGTLLNTQQTSASFVDTPQVQTSCPPAGQARAAVMPTLALGTHQNVVYLVREFGATRADTLKRYDVATGQKTEVLKLFSTIISLPQVSADGQWILFVNGQNQQAKLQLVRMDGRFLQTLYCGPVTNLLWTTNQQLIIFNSTVNKQDGTFLLHTRTGKLELELKPLNSGPPLNIDSVAQPLTWLDNTRLYVRFANFPIAPIDRLAILDTGRGPNQSFSNLIPVFQDRFATGGSYPCWDADSSFDTTTLFTSQCKGLPAPNCSGSCVLGTREGPSVIKAEPARGGIQRTILSNAKLGIATVRSVTTNLLLLLVENFSHNHSVDKSQNGIWEVQNNGSGLKRLTTEAANSTTTLCPYTQNPWSNVSRDGRMYVFATFSVGNFPVTNTLAYASLNGGPSHVFASIADGTQLSIIGWTRM